MFELVRHPNYANSLIIFFHAWTRQYKDLIVKYHLNSMIDLYDLIQLFLISVYFFCSFYVVLLSSSRLLPTNAYTLDVYNYSAFVQLMQRVLLWIISDNVFVRNNSKNSLFCFRSINAACSSLNYFWQRFPSSSLVASIVFLHCYSPSGVFAFAPSIDSDTMAWMITTTASTWHDLYCLSFCRNCWVICIIVESSLLNNIFLSVN
jgi:hypothetical protein